MDENFTPILVAIIGLFQVGLAIFFARRNNEALAEKDRKTAEKEEALATAAIGSSYATLVEKLERRLERLEQTYDSLCDEYENDKILWEIERQKLISDMKTRQQDCDDKYTKLQKDHDNLKRQVNGE